MSVFLRWGIFGILGVAAVMYAYNASKHFAEVRAGREKPVPAAAPNEAVGASTPQSRPSPASASGAAPAKAIPPHCQAELEVAQRALDARREGEPIDRLLRIQEIAFQEQPRRTRLEAVATRWYQWTGEEPSPEALRESVVRNCEMFTPAP